MLTTGIILRKVTDLGFEPILLISVGILFKIHYIISKARNGEYKPGYELMFLFIGLIIFLSGLYLRSQEATFNTTFIILTGISLKLVFIILFVINIKSQKKLLK